MTMMFFKFHLQSMNENTICFNEYILQNIHTYYFRIHTTRKREDFKLNMLIQFIIFYRKEKEKAFFKYVIRNMKYVI